MLAILSPAKTLDYDTVPPTDESTNPDFLADSEELIRCLRALSEGEIGALMSISPKLAALNRERYLDWKPPFTLDNAKQALFAFKGDVYTGFDLESYGKRDFRFAQDHLRILSGLYGMLRPLDLMQPYRLEMGTKLATGRGKDLYGFWGDRLTTALNQAIAGSGSKILVNLASNEYYGAIQPGGIDARIITPAFKDLKKGNYKIISFFAKKARGAMADHLIRNRIKDAEEIKEFTGLGYVFNPSLSDERSWIFTRDKAVASEI